jgi:4-amino-4-deoxy-L-arabinose transferase-like glycosyltransferase
MTIGSWQQNNRMLLLLWTCFMVRGIFYSVLFPVWEGYDEFAHFAVVQHLVTTHLLPLTTTPVSKEVQESLKLVPLPWLLRDLELPHTTHDEYWKLPEEERNRRQRAFGLLPREWAKQPGTVKLLNWEAQQPPLYYWILSFPLQLAGDWSLPGRVVLLRLLSVGLASLVVPLGFQIARRVLGSVEAATGIVALLAAMPELMVDLCRVGNDSLGLLMYSLLMYAAFRFVERPKRLSTAALLGLSLGLGLLTKAYFLTALPAVAVIMVCSCGTGSRSVLRRRVLYQGLFAATLAFLISGWWYWRNHVVTGSFSGVMPDAALRNTSLWDVLRQIPRVDWRSALDSIMVSHIWFGNWSFLQVRSWIYHVFMYAVPLSLLGLAIVIVAPRVKKDWQFPFLASRKHLIVLIVVYGFFWLGLLYHVLITFAAQGFSTSQGWYLYCQVVAEVLVITTGLLALSPAYVRPWVLPAATAGFGLLDLYTVHFLFIPYYVGLVSHRANGTLTAFHIGQLQGINWWDFLARLAIHKSLLNVPGLLVIWACYVAATLGLIAIGFRAERTVRSLPRTNAMRSDNRLHPTAAAPSGSRLKSPARGRRG